MIPELTNGLMVFLRVSAMLAVFPVFSAQNFPVQLRLALGALWPSWSAPPCPLPRWPRTFWGLAGQMAMEIGIGLLLGFASRMVFYALEIAGAIVGIEIGLAMPAGLNPMSDTSMTPPGTILYYLAVMLWLTLDMHHWMLAGFQRTYSFLPVGGAHLSQAFLSGHRGADERHLRRCPATGRPAHGGVVYHFPDLFRAGPGGPADECFQRELRRAAAGRD